MDRWTNSLIAMQCINLMFEVYATGMELYHKLSTEVISFFYRGVAYLKEISTK